MRTVQFRKHPFIAAVIGVLATLVTLFLVAVLCIIIFSETLVRTLIEVKGSEFLDREISVDGDIDINWHWRYTRLHIEQLRLRNAEDFSEPDMVRVELIDLHFKPLRLLRGQINISELTVVAPEIYLERKTAESANWMFPSLMQDKPDDAVVDERNEFPVIDQLHISRGHIVFKDELKGLNLDLQLDSVTANDETTIATTPGFEKGYSLTGTGTLQEQEFRITAAGGSLEELRDSSAPFPLRLTLEMGATRVSLDGRFQDPIKLEGIDAILKIKGASLADIFYLTAIPLPPTPEYTLEGQLTKAGSVWAYRDFKGRVGSSDLAGSLSYDLSGERGFLTADLTSNVLDAADLGGFIGLSPEGEATTGPSKLIPDVPLARERLLATDLDIHLKAEKIEAPNLPFKGMDVRFNLRAGVLKLDPLNLVLADGRIEGSIEIDANPDVPPMKMNLLLRQLNLNQFFKDTRFEPTTRGLFGGKVSLAGRGESLADVLATSNGDLALIMSGGEISLLLIEAADLDIGQALPLFLGKDKSTRINCGVMNFNVEDGKLTSNVVALDTKDSLLIGNVDINLKNEVINARLDAKPKDNSLVSLRIPITISGKLKSPSIGLDKEKTANRSVAVIALGALLTPFAAILALVEKGDAPDADCRAMIREARKK